MSERTSCRASVAPAPGAVEAVGGSPVDVTVVIPAYNECDGIGRTIDEVREALDATGLTYELLVVDDGSEDGTGDVAREHGARVLQLPANRGYGAALKAGIRAADSELVAILDADGTYPAHYLPELVARCDGVAMAVGARPADLANVPLIRRPGKRILTRLAEFLSDAKIPDLNSGMRVMQRRVLEQFLPILPSGFSFTTTITLSVLCTGQEIAYLPIEYRPRIGSSKIRPSDFGRFVILVLRTIVLFNPLKVFLPAGALIFALGTAKFIYDLFLWNLSESAVMAFLAAVIIWAVGLLADMIARLQLGATPGPHAHRRR